MKTLILGILLSFTANANQCANLEEIADSFKKDLKAELNTATFPSDSQGQSEFKARFMPKFSYLKALKHNIDNCYQDYGDKDMSYGCNMVADVIKEKRDGLVTSYTSAISVDYDCLPHLFLGHTITKNEVSKKTIYMQISDSYLLNSLYECSGSYTTEENSFRKFILSPESFFVMDQYMIYRTDVKVLGKKYLFQNKNEFKVDFSEREVIFNYGKAFIAISKEDGTVTRTNFLTMDEVTDGTCQTCYDAAKEVIYPRTNIDEARWGFELKYISH